MTSVCLHFECTCEVTDRAEVEEKAARNPPEKPEGFLQDCYLNQIHLKGNLGYISVVAGGCCLSSRYLFHKNRRTEAW